LFFNYSLGVKNLFGGDFDYKKIQVFYKHPFFVGGFGRLTPIIEAGKIYGTVPLGLMSVLPGNQSFFRIENAFSQLNYYEFVTDLNFWYINGMAFYLITKELNKTNLNRKQKN